jgi:Domain of unknown function (DUF4032)
MIPSESPVRQVAMSDDDWMALRSLPWGIPLESWHEHEPAVQIIDQRRGLSRHPVLFVQSNHRKYAIKETSPTAADEEIANFVAIADRGVPTLTPVGTVIVVGEPIYAGSVAGVAMYESGDVGYCITRLATRVLPQSLLYQYPFTEENKEKLLIAVARLLTNMHSAGIYWGDASLANTLINLGHRQLTAILADAETVVLYEPPLSETLRQDDLDYFVEALMMQSEDIRIARNMPESETILDDSDAQFFRKMYDQLRMPNQLLAITQEIESAISQLGSGVLSLGSMALRAGQASVESTIRPGWYRDQLRDLMGIWIPRSYARRIYALLLGHKWLMSEEAGRDVGLAFAAADWRERYHDPLIRLLQTYNPGQPIDYDRYLRIMNHIWQLSRNSGHPMPIEEGAIDYLLPS